MEDFFLDLIDDYPVIMGTVMILIGFIWLVFRIRKKESSRMEDHGQASWGELVSTWGVIIFTIIWGTILILRNF